MNTSSPLRNNKNILLESSMDNARSIDRRYSFLGGDGVGGGGGGDARGTPGAGIVGGSGNIQQASMSVQTMMGNLGMGADGFSPAPQPPYAHPFQSRRPSLYLDSVPNFNPTDPTVMNPLKRRTLKQTLNIDTRFRNFSPSSLSTNFQYDLPLRFSKVVQMELTAMELPGAMYNITASSENNAFVLGLSSNGNASMNIWTITVPDGYYDIYSLVATINQQMATISELAGIVTLLPPPPPPSGSAPTSLPTNLRVEFQLNAATSATNTLVLLFTPTAVSAFANVEAVPLTDVLTSWGFDSTSGPSGTLNTAMGLANTYDMLPFSLGWMLGFRQQQYLVTVGTTANPVFLKPESLPDVIYPKYVFLSVNDFNNNVPNVFTTCFNASSSSGKNVLARITSPTVTSTSLIPMENRFFGIVGTVRDYFGPVDISKLHIQLLDEYGRILNTNPFDYSFCLQLTVVYDL